MGFSKNKKRGFTLIELLIVVGIITVLLTIVFASLLNTRKNSRLAAGKSAGRSALAVIVACKNLGGIVNAPSGSESAGNKLVCAGDFSNAFWAPLKNGYTYVLGGNYDSPACNFQIDTNGDRAGPIICDCLTMSCR